jgi:hypothetical protein
MVYNTETKEAHYRWRRNNPDKYKAYINKGAKKYYQTNKDVAKEKALKRYYFNKEAEIFRNILID